MKVLVVENNQLILQQLCDLLEKQGYATLPAPGGEAALKIWRENKPDFVCLDIVMDDMSGHDVCKEIRKTDKAIPIIFITSKSATVDKVSGFDVGADDYITKPFDIEEVIARMRAVARRCLGKTSQSNDSFKLGGLMVYPNQLRGEKAGIPVDLSLRDIKILRLFHDNAGKIIDRNRLLDHCWGAHIMPESRTVDWHIAQLRKKIEDDPANPALIKTMHGAGYKYDVS